MGYFKPFFHLILHAPHHTRALLSMKMAVFTDSPMNFVARPGKEGKSRTRRAKLQGYPEKGPKIRTGHYKKRDTLERMSPNLYEMPDQVGHDCLVITGLTGNLLLIKCCRNVNGTSNCTTYHRVVTDAEESHHLNVCWN